MNFMRPLHVTLSYCVALLATVQSSLIAQEQLATVTVRESAGIRRFGYPAHARLRFETPIDSQEELELKHNGKTIRAQFRPVKGSVPTQDWDVDWNLSLLPGEMIVYDVHRRSARKNSAQGLSISTGHSALSIQNRSFLFWEVPINGVGLIDSVHTKEIQYTGAKSSGIVLVDKEGASHSLGSPSLPIRLVPQRVGPFAINLAGESTGSEDSLSKVRVTIGLEFVVSKSWVRVTCDLEDPASRLKAVTYKLNLNTPAKPKDPVLVDFGVGSMTYLALREGEQASMEASPIPNSSSPGNWLVKKGRADRLLPFSKAAPDWNQLPEGWAHVMNSRVCLAVAIDQFATKTADVITVRSDGEMSMTRLTDGKSVRFQFWMHFVPYPPHITAATSPQSMLKPLEISIAK